MRPGESLTANVDQTLVEADAKILDEGILILEVAEQHKVLNADIVMLSPLGSHRAVEFVSHIW